MLTTVAPTPEEAFDPAPPPRLRPKPNRWPMYWALARKELRELAPWILLAGLAEVYLLCAMVGMRVPFFRQSPAVIPFIEDTAVYLMFWVAGIFGGVAGLWQTIWESSRGTFQFLLHRPMQRLEFFVVKLVTGTTMTLLLCGLPVGLYAMWAATPGTHASPFAWSMTGWAWAAWLCMPVVYLGAFLSGLRPARWYASRFLPLAGSLLVFALAIGLLGNFVVWSGPLLALVAQACLVVATLYEASTRDYS